jgi:hypothetical protein
MKRQITPDLRIKRGEGNFSMFSAPLVIFWVFQRFFKVLKVFEGFSRQNGTLGRETGFRGSKR